MANKKDSSSTIASKFAKLSEGNTVSDLKAYILCRFAETSSVYTSWMSESPLPVVVVDEYLPDWPVPSDAGILITHMHYR